MAEWLERKRVLILVLQLGGRRSVSAQKLTPPRLQVASGVGGAFQIRVVAAQR